MAKSHKVTFLKSGITIDVAEDEYILEEAEDAGLHLPYDCRNGTCTTCIQKCLEGEIDQDMAFAIGDEELEQGLRLICIGSPSPTSCSTPEHHLERPGSSLPCARSVD